MSIKSILRKIPWLRDLWHKAYKDYKQCENHMLRKSVINHYRNSSDTDIKGILSFLKKYDLCLYNYDWYLQYLSMKPSIEYDEKLKLYYFTHNGRNVYYTPYMSKESAVHDFNLMSAERNPKCPHCYDNFIGNDEKFDVIIDGGVAEGMFSLDHLANCNKLILIEGDRDWNIALNHTFKPEIESGKIVLINKFLSDIVDKENVTLDYIFDNYIAYGSKVCIKLDIEGYEERAILSADKLLNSCNKVRLITCTYHHQESFHNIKKIFDQKNISCKPSKGYIFLFPDYEKKIFHYNSNLKIQSFLRKALLVGEKG